MTPAVYRWTALTGYFGLLGLLILWKALLNPSPYFPVALVLVVFVGPLLLPLRGLLHARPYTHAWASLLALFYFAHGLVEALSATEAQALALLQTLLALLLFAGCLGYVRSRQPRDPRTEA